MTGSSRPPGPTDEPGAPLHVVIAPLRRRDLGAVLAIEDAVFDEPWSRRLFEEELAQRTSRAYRGAWVANRLVGYAGQMSVDDEAHVNSIGVEPAWQGRRLGTVLMCDLVRTALARGSAHLTLEVLVGNEPAISLYRRFGMAPVGVRPELLPERWGRPDHVGSGHRQRGVRRAAVGHRGLARPRCHRGAPGVRRVTGRTSRWSWIGSSAVTATATVNGAPPIRRVLGIETSCDETAASVVDDGTTIISSVVSSQIDLHARYGGVVPELAGRAHVELLTPVLADALEQAGSDHTGRGIDGIAVTHGPGLIGSLLVGVAEAKALSLAWGVPMVGVNHLESHLFASLLEQPDLGWPLVVLLVSGGHTMLIDVTAPGAVPTDGRDDRRRRR